MKNHAVPRGRRKRAQLAVRLTALSAVVLAWPAHAAIVDMTLGMGSSGTGPFDASSGPGLDASAGDTVVRTYDTVMHRAGYSLSPPDTNALIHLELGATSVPAGYTGPANPQIAYFSVADIPTGAEGCANIQSSPVSNPPPAGQSGVTADGKHLFCYQPGPVSAGNLLFNYRISGDAPNGATVGPLKYSFQSDNNPLKTDPTILNNPGHATQPTYGNNTLTVSAAPRWNVTKFNSTTTTGTTRGTFIPGSGPGGEDGYMVAFNVGVSSQGSRKGLEALEPNFSIKEDYTNADQPNLRLVTWDINNAFANFRMSAGNHDGCGNWISQLSRVGNSFDNAYYHPVDYGPAGNTSSHPGAVANGGDCKATSVNDLGATSKTATLDFTGVDSSLKTYPTQRGTNASVKLVNTNNLEDPTNEWWVASKSVVMWAPVTDFTLNTVEQLTNKVELDAKSVTGQTATSTAQATATVERRAGGSMSKRYTPWHQNYRVGAYNGLDYALQDPNITGDAYVNQVAPGQYFAARLVMNNSGDTTSTSGYVCDRIDNARTTFAGQAGVTALPSDARYRIDADTGIGITRLTGPIDVKLQLGVDGAGITGGTWDSFTNVSDENLYPSTAATSAQAAQGCGDGDATWYDSIAALQAAGKSLQDVSRVRATFPNGFGGAMNIHLFVPLVANSTYSFTANDGGTTHAAGTSTTDHISPNQATWVTSFGNPIRDADAVRITQNQIIGISKSEEPSTLTSGRGVMRGSTLTYKLQVNATSGTSAQTADITVWDVLPQHQIYVPGSSAQGGTAIADPVCAAPGVTPASGPFAANSVPAGYQACYWVLTNQPVVKDVAGAAAGNLPALTYRVRVALEAPIGTSLLNSAFADSPANTRYKATYTGANGFTCTGAQPCSFSNWNVQVNAQTGVHLDKEVSATTAPPNGSFSYTLRYTTVGESLNQFRVLDVLPYSGDARSSSYTGTLKLSAPIATPVAGAGLTADPALVMLYTSNAPANIISNDPYHASHNLNGTGANGASSTNWCTVAQFGSANCPATVGDATAFMALAYGPTGTMPQNTAYELIVPVTTSGNAFGNHTYTNNFVADSPTLLARRPGSNNVTTRVTGATGPAVVNVSGRIYTETGGNTTDDGNATDPGMAGVTVQLVCAAPNAYTASTTSDATGNYSFANVPANGVCTLTQSQPPGVENAYNTLGVDATSTTGNTGTDNSVIQLSLNGRDSTGNNFAEKPPATPPVPTASIGGRVYTETGGNTTDDGNGTDPGIAGVSVALVCTSPAYTASATTGTDGSYSFANVPVGANCTLTQTQPTGVENAYTSTGGTATPETGSGNSTITLQVPTGGSNDANFAEKQPATPPAVTLAVAGRVYVENSQPANTVNNGNATDPGLSGVTVELVCTSPAYGPATTTTGNDGSYSFANVPANASCTLTQTQPAGYDNAYTLSGGTATTETGSANSVINLTTPASGPANGYDFAEQAKPSALVSGRVYTETGGNTTDDGNGTDPGLPGVTVTMVCTNPAYTASTTTGSDGSYSFNAPVGANCTLTQTQPTGVQNAYTTTGGTATPETGTGNSTISLQVPATGSTGNSFAEKPAAASTTTSVSGRVYTETGGNTTDNGQSVDPGLPGVVINLVCTSPAYSATTTTGSDGSYSLSGVPVGANCTLTQTQPAGHTNAYTSTGGTATPETGTGNSVISLVPAAGGSTGNNFAEQPGGGAVGSVSGRVFVEGNGNTTDDGPAADPGIPGVTVELMCTAPAYGPVTTTTGSNGSYSFANVPLGANCTLTQHQPAGYNNVYTAASGTPTAESGNANSIVTFVMSTATSLSPLSFAEIRAGAIGPVAVPTLGWPMLAALSALLAGIGGWRRQRQAA